MMRRLKFVVTVTLAMVGMSAIAEPITREDAQKAAIAFLTQDGVGRQVLAGRMTGEIVQRDNLWIVRLVPNGAIVLAGSDLVSPLIAFSANDFVEPLAGSAFYDRLERANATSLAAELPSSGKSERHSKWVSLIGTREPSMLLAASAVNVPSEAIVVSPFLTTHWSQWQPYNDFAPIYDESVSTRAYRGRAPCGCTATAAAQVFAHWKWPRRAKTREYVHEAIDFGDGTFDIRFNADVPFDWEGLADDYPYYKSGYDLRGKVAEATRYPIARLMLWCDSISQMYFSEDGSGAHIYYAYTCLTDWYALMQYTDCEYEPQAARNKVKADLEAGRPVNVSISGHAIVAHGWASDSTSDYVYVNYGWGGTNDGWMTFDELVDVSTGLYPLKMVQLDPLPAVSGTTLTPTWAFPDCYTNAVTGFEVALSVQGTTPTTWEAGETVTLPTNPNATHAFDARLGVTSQSSLSYSIRSELTLGAKVTIEAKRDGGDWEVISTPTLNPSSYSWAWSNYNVPLSDFAGDDVKLRIALEYVGPQYYREGYVSIKDVKLSNVLTYASVDSQSCSPTARSATISNCAVGSKAEVSVTPLFGNERGIAGKSSTRIASAAPIQPAILKVEGLGTAVSEGFYRENAIASNALHVTCSESVTSLKAWPSHRTLLKDEDVAVLCEGAGRFGVVFKPSGTMPDRSRMILTLEASDDNGTKAFKDVVLRFNSEIEEEIYVPVGKDAVIMTDGAGNEIAVPTSWFVDNGLVSAGASVYDCVGVVNQDADGDGVVNWKEYVCGTDPCDGESKLSCTITIENGETKVDYTPKSGFINGYKAVLQGKTTLDAENWSVKTSSHRFFRVSIERD